MAGRARALASPVRSADRIGWRRVGVANQALKSQVVGFRQKSHQRSKFDKKQNIFLQVFPSVKKGIFDGIPL